MHLAVPADGSMPDLGGLDGTVTAKPNEAAPRAYKKKLTNTTSDFAEKVHTGRIIDRCRPLNAWLCPQSI